MESLRTFLACLFLRSRARREGYTELLYDSLEYPPALNEKYSDFPNNDHGDVIPYTTATQTQTHPNGDQYQSPERMNPSLPFNPPDRSPSGYSETALLARQIAHLLFSARENDDALQARILDAVGARRRCWNRRLIEECLDNVIEYVERGRSHCGEGGEPMGDAMVSALDLATDLADEEFSFPRRHPDSVDGFIAAVSVGILAQMLGAWVLELLGFGQVRQGQGQGQDDAAAEEGEVPVEEKDEVRNSGVVVVKMSTNDKIVMGDRPRRGSVADWWAREYGEYIPRGAVYKYLKRLDMVESD